MTLGSEQQFPLVRVGPWSENEPSGAWDCPADVETVDSDLTLSLLSPLGSQGCRLGRPAALWEQQEADGSRSGRHPSSCRGAGGSRWASPAAALPSPGLTRADLAQSQPLAALRGGKEATGRGALPLPPQTHASAPGARTAPDTGPLHRHRVLRPLL